VEALLRNRPPAKELPKLIDRLADEDRSVAYLAMQALAHYPRNTWIAEAWALESTKAKMRALVATDLRGERPSVPRVQKMVTVMMEAITSQSSRQERLDLLRILGRFRKSLEGHPKVRGQIQKRLVYQGPDRDPDLRYEQARLLGEYRIAAGIPWLLSQMRVETDAVVLFHFARALSRIDSGWSKPREDQLVGWLVATQHNWFARYDGKGRQFPEFWASVLSDFARIHLVTFMEQIDQIELTSALGAAILDELTSLDGSSALLLQLYRNRDQVEDREALLTRFGRIQSEEVRRFLVGELRTLRLETLRTAALLSLSRQEAADKNVYFLEEGLQHSNPEVVEKCALALARHRPPLTEQLAQLTISRLQEPGKVAAACELLLALWGSAETHGETERSRQEVLQFWRGWYAEQFGKPFENTSQQDVPIKEDTELHEFLLSATPPAEPSLRGHTVYAALCARCHGGTASESPQTIFGPDLTGVTRRLTRPEIADAIVYPSKQVAERFQAKSVTLRNRVYLDGFITADDDDTITLVDQQQVHRLLKSNIVEIRPMSSSLMPSNLLNHLSYQEILDLLSFLENLGAQEPGEGH
jgi:putative heme-binding domain-containing protein